MRTYFIRHQIFPSGIAKVDTSIIASGYSITKANDAFEANKILIEQVSSGWEHLLFPKFSDVCLDVTEFKVIEES